MTALWLVLLHWHLVEVYCASLYSACCCMLHLLWFTCDVLCFVCPKKQKKGQDHVLLLKGPLVGLECAPMQIRGLVFGSVALRTPPQACSVRLVIWNCAPLRIKGLGCSCPG